MLIGVRESRWPILVALFAAVCAYQFYIFKASPLVPFMDSIRYITQIDGVLRGDLAWAQIYGAGEHKGLMYPFFTLIEWVLWGLDSRITTSLTGLLLVGQLWLWINAAAHGGAYGARDELDRGRTIKNAMLFASAALIVTSPAGFEIWTLDLGFAQVAKNLIFVAFLYELSLRAKWLEGARPALTMGLLGAGIILLVAYGWSIAFFVAAVASSLMVIRGRRGGFRELVLLLGPMTLAQVGYILSMEGGVVTNQASITANGSGVGQFIFAAAYGAGTTFAGSEVIAELGIGPGVVMMAGGGLIGLCLIGLVRAYDHTFGSRAYFVGLAAFGLVTLLSVAFARGGGDFRNAGASRYYMDYVWLLLGTVGLLRAKFGDAGGAPVSVCNPHIGRAIQAFRWFVVLLGVVVPILATLGHLTTWKVELAKAPYRAEAFRKMGEVYLDGVQRDDDASLLQSPRLTAAHAMEIVENYRLGVWRSVKAGCSLEEAMFRYGWHAPENDGGRWANKVAALIIGGCGGAVRIEGALPRNSTARLLRTSIGDRVVETQLAAGRNFAVILDMPSSRPRKITFAVDMLDKSSSESIGAVKGDFVFLITSIGPSLLGQE